MVSSVAVDVQEPVTRSVTKAPAWATRWASSRPFWLMRRASSVRLRVLTSRTVPM